MSDLGVFNPSSTSPLPSFTMSRALWTWRMSGILARSSRLHSNRFFTDSRYHLCYTGKNLLMASSQVLVKAITYFRPADCTAWSPGKGMALLRLLSRIGLYDWAALWCRQFSWKSTWTLGLSWFRVAVGPCSRSGSSSWAPSGHSRPLLALFQVG